MGLDGVAGPPPAGGRPSVSTGSPGYDVRSAESADLDTLARVTARIRGSIEKVIEG